MKFKVLANTILVMTSFAASVSYAGFRDTRTVQVDLVNMVASGAIGDARNSADANQTIGCQVNATVGSAAQASCRARAATGGYVGCNSNASDVISVVGNIGSDSFVQFGWDGSGNCRFVTVDNDSRWAPKGP